MSKVHYDFVVIGAGVIGLTIAREIQKRKLGSVAVLEKESKPACHASGRNSGVVHAGLYYTPGSLKARLCIEGARRLEAFAEEHDVPYLKNGKVIVAKNADEQGRMEDLFQRSLQNGVQVEKVSSAQLAQLEPEATTHEWAIYSPNTALIDPKEMMARLARLIEEQGGKLLANWEVVEVDTVSKKVESRDSEVSYEFLINAAGMYADRIAHAMELGDRYRILPFRGLYRRVHGHVANRCKVSVYPMPDLNMPFLGVHLTPGLAGKVFAGPTAQPAFGRENYGFFRGVRWDDAWAISQTLFPKLLTNRDKMRNLALGEMQMFSKWAMARELKKMLPGIEAGQLGEFEKVGLRAQLIDVEKDELVQDFVIEKGRSSIHILNAVSPGLTSSLAFSEYVVDQIVA